MQVGISRVIETGLLQQPLPLQHPFQINIADISQINPAFLLNHFIVNIPPKTGGDTGKYVILLPRLFIRTADNERRTGFINEEIVHLVNDDVIKLPLHASGEVQDHIIPQVVETELAAGTVGDISPVSLGTGDRLKAGPVWISGIKIRVIKTGWAVFIRALLGIDACHANPQSRKNRCHPVGVAPRQVVINRSQVAALTGE